MISYGSSQNNIDGYAKISTIDVASLHVWWKALLLICSNFFGIFAIIYSISLGLYLYGASVLVSVVISIAYHICQTTDYCPFFLSLDIWQKTDHTSAGSILAVSLMLFYLYRPNRNFNNLIKSNQQKNQSNKLKKLEQRSPQTSQFITPFHFRRDKTNNYNNNNNRQNTNNYYSGESIINFNTEITIKEEEEEDEKIKKHHYHLGFLRGLEYDKRINHDDKHKICFRCRGVDPKMLYDWQSVFILYIYIFVIIVTINAIPLTLQSFVIIIVVGLVFGLIKILVIEEGDPNYLKNRFHIPSLVTGIILVILSLIFYFIDGYTAYWLFHSLWHLFNFIGLFFLVMGVTKDVPGWYSFLDILKYIGRKMKTCCCLFHNNNCCYYFCHHHGCKISCKSCCNKNSIENLRNEVIIDNYNEEQFENNGNGSTTIIIPKNLDNYLRTNNNINILYNDDDEISDVFN